jgi:two-component system, chemotaxis family, chemotaxis protein CheY
MSCKRVLSVGQCGFDHRSISRTLERTFGVEVVAVRTAAEALEWVENESFALVLVNRVFDWDGASGLELIGRIKENSANLVPVMLVSNYEDAQADAVKAGALPGFGKASLGEAAMLERVRAVLES